MTYNFLYEIIQLKSNGATFLDELFLCLFVIYFMTM
jgi:hypothetical protein